MINKLNDIMRKTVLIVGGAIIIYKLIEGAKTEQQTAEESCLEQEFDDIW